MGSAVSCTRKSKVTESALKPVDKPDKMEGSSEYGQPGQWELENGKLPTTCPGTEQERRTDVGKSITGRKDVEQATKVVEDEKDIGTEKDEGEEKENEKTPQEKLMTDEELKKFKQKTFDYLHSSAKEVLGLEKYREEGGEYVVKIRNVTIRFMQSYFALKRTKLEEINKFRLAIAEIMIETKYLNLMFELVMYTYKNGWQDENGQKNDKKFTPLTNCILTLLNFSDCSDSLAIAMANEPGFIELMKQILEDMRDRHLEKAEPKLKPSEERLFKHTLSIVHNMSMRETNTARLRSVDMITVLQPILKSPNDMYAMNSLASLAGIINEKECEIIAVNKDIVMILLDCLRKSLKNKLRRCKGWSSKECGFTVKLLARNDANMKMLVDLGALELLVELGKTGDKAEQYESVAALWALCFDGDNQTLICGKPELEVVDLLVDLKSSDNGNIRKACNGALWTLRDALKKTVIEKYRKIGEQLASKNEGERLKSSRRVQAKEAEKRGESQGHIMISYQWADQQVLKTVRDRIKARGYKVWMDIDQMGGSTLQAMADAVEGADVFLMCMSNKYKHSPACRAEAEYAFQTRKKIIPLKMERGYVPDGWLGFILGSKLFYEFSPKYPFEDKMNALLKELDTVLLGENKDTPDAAETIKPVTADVTETAAGAHAVDYPDSTSSVRQTVARISVSMATIDKVRKWTDTEVKNWIAKNSLQTCGLGKLTGGEIALLACMRVECPEYFYKCLQDMLKVNDLLTMSRIVWALHDLS